MEVRTSKLFGNEPFNFLKIFKLFHKINKNEVIKANFIYNKYDNLKKFLNGESRFLRR